MSLSLRMFLEGVCIWVSELSQEDMPSFSVGVCHPEVWGPGWRRQRKCKLSFFGRVIFFSYLKTLYPRFLFTLHLSLAALCPRVLRTSSSNRESLPEFLGCEDFRLVCVWCPWFSSLQMAGGGTSPLSSFLFCCSDKILWHKQLKARRIFFSSQSQGYSPCSRAAKRAGAWTCWLFYFHSHAC